MLRKRPARSPVSRGSEAASPPALTPTAGRRYTDVDVSMSLSGLHFLVTYRCTYSCEHCFVWGSPDLEETMTIGQLRAAIDQAAALGTVETVYFEGGEPTLSFPVVVAAASHARGRGLAFGVVTNCFWATSPEDAELWLRPFAELGIADLSVSSYPYSGEDALDDARLRNAVQAAQRLALPLGVLEVGAAARLQDLGVPCGDAGTVMYRGRAAVEQAPAAARRPPDSFTTCPHEDLLDPGRAHLGADGELQVCQGLSAGNVFRDGLRAVVGRYEPASTPIFRELLAGGPHALATAYDLRPQRDLYADECHLCYELRLRLRDRFPAILAPDVCYGPEPPDRQVGDQETVGSP
jgi:hypothetical protein